MVAPGQVHWPLWRDGQMLEPGVQRQLRPADCPQADRAPVHHVGQVNFLNRSKSLVFSGGKLRSESGEITIEDFSDANLLRFTPEPGDI